jgi:hypothetical protein
MLALLLAVQIGLFRIPFTEEMVPYAQPTVHEPFSDGVSLKVPPDLGNVRLAALGLVDVTAAPFGADPTGERDSTDAIQRAINAARDAQMVCFFPPGDYKVSGTLSCIQNLYRRANGAAVGAHLHPCVLMGGREGGRRPRIVLAPGSPGFGDPAKPRYVVHFWARAVQEGPPTQPQPNISMNQMLVGLDVVIGAGNPGAVGVRHRAAQGSGVLDCTIDATHGLTGLEGGAGSGGGHAGVTVIGGRYGLDLRETQPAPTVAGVTLIGQTEAAILCESRQALTVVGCRIVSKAAGPVIRTGAPGYAPGNGQLCLLDAEILCEGPPATAVFAGRSVYLGNVYVKGASAVVAGSKGPLLGADPAAWTRVVEYAHGVDPPAWKGLAYRAPVYLDGVRKESDICDIVADAPAPPADLVSRHLWPADLPHVRTQGAVNVREVPYNAAGDGRTDDTDALQRAVDAADVVLLPKGYYRVSRTLRLRAGTRLVGVGQHISTIFAADAEGDFADADRPRAIVQTADDAAAATVVAFCGILAPDHVPGAYPLEWRAGRRSVLLSVWPERRGLYGFSKPPQGRESRPPAAPLVQVRGGGGGRWYNLANAGRTPQVDDYRHILIEGTREPLAIYQCNVEYARSDAEMEIRGARHVTIYGLKGEYNEPILWVRDSDHVRVFGYGGNAAAFEGKSLFVIERTPNVLLANLVDSPRLAGQGSEKDSAGVGTDPAKWHMLIDRPASGPEVRTQPLDRPVLYKRGKPVGE